MANVARDGGNANRAAGVFPEDGTNGFIKFQDDNTLYNLYDAGNAITGRDRVSGGLKDSKADQQALHNGYNYGGVIWRKK